MFKKGEPQPWHRKRPYRSLRHSGSFKKGHSGQWPRPADADTRLILCPKCNQTKLLRDFLDRANKQDKECHPCHRAVLSARSRNHITRIKADPALVIAALNRLDDLQAAEAATIPGGPGNVHLWQYHIAKWARERSRLRSTYGLQPKKGVRGHFEYQAKYGIIPADTVEERIATYYERHPNERPTEGPDSQHPEPATPATE